MNTNIFTNIICGIESTYLLIRETKLNAYCMQSTVLRLLENTKVTSLHPYPQESHHLDRDSPLNHLVMINCANTVTQVQAR